MHMEQENSGTTQAGRNLVDPATGELFENIVVIRNQKQQEIIYHERELKAIRAAQDSKPDTFYFVDNKKLKGVGASMDLSFKQYGYLAVLGCYSGYKDGLLRLSDSSNVPMTKTEIKKVLKISKDNTINELIKLFEKKGLLEIKTAVKFGKKYKAYHLKRDLIFRKSVSENRSTKETTRVFIETLKQVYSDKEVGPADVGLILLCLPYVNKYSNLLSQSTEEMDPRADQAITVSELAEILHLSTKALQAKLSAARFKGMYVFAKISVGKNRILKMNPLVARRNYPMPDAATYAEFVIKQPKTK